MDIISFYQTNNDFRDFLNKYCDYHNITIEAASKHLIVKATAKYYKDKENRCLAPENS